MPEHTPHSSLTHSLGMHQDVKSCKRQMQHAACSLRQLPVVLKLLPSFHRGRERAKLSCHRIHNINVCPKIVREVLYKSFPSELVNFELTREMHSMYGNENENACNAWPTDVAHRHCPTIATFPPETMFIIRRQTVFNLSIYDTVGCKLFLVAPGYYNK